MRCVVVSLGCPRNSQVLQKRFKKSKENITVDFSLGKSIEKAKKIASSLCQCCDQPRGRCLLQHRNALGLFNDEQRCTVFKGQNKPERREVSKPRGGMVEGNQHRRRHQYPIAGRPSYASQQRLKQRRRRESPYRVPKR